MKPFNGKLYMILSIKQEEKKDILEIVSKYNLKTQYPQVFDEVSNLDRFTIDDECFGGHLASFICYYEYSVIQNSNKGIFKDVQELKAYLDKADQRIEHPFLKVDDTNEYSQYVVSLSNENLEDEYYIVSYLINLLTTNYMVIKDDVNALIKNINNNLKRKITKEDINNYLKEIRELRQELDQLLDFDIYLINKHNCYQRLVEPIYSDNEDVKHMNMRSYLIRTHHHIHYSDKSELSILKSMRDNLDIIFHIFNFKLNVEGIASYKNDTYNCIRQLGYPNNCPDYLVGKKVGKGWNYQSVAKRLIYTLKIYDCYPLLSNNIIQLTIDSLEAVEELTNKLVNFGYQDPHDLCHVSLHEYPPVAVLIKPNEKIIDSSQSGTIMACMCDARKRQPLRIKDILGNFERIIINYDFVFYNLLLLDADSKKRFKGLQLII